MYCKKCGYELPDDSLFCTKCGTKIDIPDLAENAQTNIFVDRNSQTVEKSNEIHDAHYEIGFNTASEPPKKSAKKAGIFLAIVAVCLGIMIGWAAYSKNHSQEIEESEEIIEQVDFSTVQGAPELYDLKWGMTYSDVMRLTPFTPSVIFSSSPNGLPVKTNSPDTLNLKIEDFPDVFGMKPAFCASYCYYSDNRELNSVAVAFSSDKYPFETVVSVF